MIKVFLDANVLFSAANSPTGGSAYVVELARAGKLRLFSSRLAVKEAERNLREKSTEAALLRFYDLLDEVTIELFDTNRARAKKSWEYLVGAKDAPILAAAIVSKAQFLITLDKKHFLNPQVLGIDLPIKILRPGGFIENYL
ncbi:MAG: putative toxin-antitoxin system toxin component, PIN family [Candidatus Woykebacteria bacterium RBG_16_44_10]|uniref:Putative toxin-antitoxin system toxin component, PIN family n=1 Tax=Candidatus Woykebacteria bacterium RBG_16_44_10 TaxID=1802597 RepID=A0A1G1WE95_9BACT|nr:MAG: putative toxin-antitoxin system toxin component, PIN family [Candidatus Woykebacteria bacterium RBG_16_44_10]